MTKQYNDEELWEKINALKEDLGSDLYYSLPMDIVRNMLGIEDAEEEHG